MSAPLGGVFAPRAGLDALMEHVLGIDFTQPFQRKGRTGTVAQTGRRRRSGCRQKALGRYASGQAKDRGDENGDDRRHAGQCPQARAPRPTVKRFIGRAGAFLVPAGRGDSNAATHACLEPEHPPGRAAVIRRQDVAERRLCRALRRSASGAAEHAAHFGIRRQHVVVGGEDGVADGLDDLEVYVDGADGVAAEDDRLCLRSPDNCSSDSTPGHRPSLRARD